MATDGPAGTGLPESSEKYLAEYNHPNILLVIGRSKNQNIVVYEAAVEGGALREENAVEAYWLDIDPAYVTANRKKGKTDDRVELGMMESTMAYGVKAKSNGDGTFAVTMVALPGREMTLLMVEGKPRLATEIAGKRAYVERVHVETKEGWIKPTVLYVDFFGVDAETGARVTERLTEGKK